MFVRSSSVILACAVVLSAISPAHGQSQSAANRKKALELYDRGKVQYDLGRWQAAIDLWMKAYETFTAPEFLFNIAQAYRHEDNCERALFFYRRYLATRQNAPNRGEVQGHIAQLEKKCKPKPDEGGGTGPPGGETGDDQAGDGEPPDETAGEEPPGAERREVAEAEQGAGEREPADPEQEQGDLEQRAEPEDEQPHLFALRLAAGPSFPSLGPLDVGTLVSLTAGIGHPVYLGSVMLEPGALVTYSPVPWEVQGSEGSEATTGTAGMTGVMANLGAAFEFIPNLSGRVDAGIGALIFSGLTETGNPFLDMNDVADGAISMFHVRGALGLEYAISRNFTVHAQPVVFSFSPSRPLREEIDSITRFEMLVGAGYRM
jgi:hypothetical protein